MHQHVATIVIYIIGYHESLCQRTLLIYMILLHASNIACDWNFIKLKGFEASK